MMERMMARKWVSHKQFKEAMEKEDFKTMARYGTQDAVDLIAEILEQKYEGIYRGIYEGMKGVIK